MVPSVLVAASSRLADDDPRDGGRAVAWAFDVRGATQRPSDTAALGRAADDAEPSVFRDSSVANAVAANSSSRSERSRKMIRVRAA
jgi:hypothetical protein